MKNLVKDARLERQLSQTELAKLSGVSRATIIALETNKCKEYKVETLRKIAKALKKAVTEIFFLD